MLQLVRTTALVSIVFVALGAVGKTSSSVALGSLTDGASVCTTTTDLDLAVDAVDYAGAVLIANNEPVSGLSSEEIRDQIASLPAYDDSDGVSVTEAAAFSSLLKLGRQLTYAVATEELERLIQGGPDGIRVASAEGQISFEVLEALRGDC